MKNPYEINIDIIPRNNKGQFHGHVKLFYSNGAMKEEGHYVNGKLNGQGISYYYLTHLPMTKFNYLNGKRFGLGFHYKYASLKPNDIIFKIYYI